MINVLTPKWFGDLIVGIATMIGALWCLFSYGTFILSVVMFLIAGVFILVSNFKGPIFSVWEGVGVIFISLLFYGGASVLSPIIGETLTGFLGFVLIGFCVNLWLDWKDKQGSINGKNAKSQTADTIPSDVSRHISNEVRAQVRIKYNHQCAICHRTEKETGTLHHIDHIHPFSKGGTNNINNLQLLCQDCNLKKRDQW